MRTIFLILVIAGTIFNFGMAGELYQSDDFGCKFDLPDGWIADQISAARINIYDSLTPGISLDVFRHVIEKSNRIESDEDMSLALSGLYAEMGIGRTSSGPPEFYISGAEAIFKAAWVIDYGDDQIPDHKLLNGIVARLANGEQILYLMVAEIPSDLYEQKSPAISEIVNSFKITTPLAEHLYPKRDFFGYLFLLLILAITAFFYARNRRIQKSNNPLGRDSGNFWRCPSCRKINHKENRSCSRCGEPRAAVSTHKS